MSWHYSWTTSYWALGNYTSQNVLDNATEAYNQMRGVGWTHEASIGAIANLCYESTGLNAGQWQGGFGGYYKTNQGFGMAQWTPWTKVRDYVGGQTQSLMMNPSKQIQMLLSQSSQWSTGLVNKNGYSSYYGITVPYFSTFSAYSQGKADVEDMTAAYMVCWERPGKENALATRKQYAKYFDEKIGGGSSTTKYVTIQVEGNGVAYAIPSYGEAGDTITLKYIELGTDTFIKWSVVSGGVTISDKDTFKLGSSNVVIKAYFTGDTPSTTGHKITVKITGGGSAYSLPTYADKGETVTVYIDETSKYKLRNITSNDVTLKKANKNEYTFTMPDKDVTIYVRFKKVSGMCYYLRPLWTY